MNLRFAVDQAEAFRRGIDAPKSIATIDVKPSDIPQEIRNLIADRMDGIDVCKIELVREEELVDRKMNGHAIKVPIPKVGGKLSRRKSMLGDQKHLVMAILPSLDSLVEAVKADEDRIAREEQSAKAGARRSFAPREVVGMNALDKTDQLEPT